jgi:hypothetical protein
VQVDAHEVMAHDHEHKHAWLDNGGMTHAVGLVWLES